MGLGVRTTCGDCVGGAVWLSLWGVIYLLVVSLVWSFSFSLFKAHLAGLDPSLMAFLRMALALPLFLPLLRVRGLRGTQVWGLLGIGAVQYGLMYVALNLSYRYLEGWQVALMTIFTPLYVSLIDGVWRRRVDGVYLATALLAVVGAAVIEYSGRALEGRVVGFLLVQGANACFAFGQLAYRELRRGMGDASDAQVYALPYLGALAITAGATVFTGGWGGLPGITGVQWAVLLYLGAVASGVSFFLWNIGATRVNTGTLAVMNNMKVPLAVAVGVIAFGEKADVLRLLLGGGIMVLGVVAAEWHGRRARAR
jgi:drug/metabolite transporter (DMT)-like permease